MRRLTRWALPQFKNGIRFAVPGLVFSSAFAFAACGDNALTDSCPTPMGSGGMTAASSAAGPGATTTGATSTSTSSTSGTTAASSGGNDGSMTSGKDGDTFDHFNDSLDPFKILKDRAEEGPPEIRTRLHSCTKVAYDALGDYLTSRGVDLSKTSSVGQTKTAGELYKTGGDAMGIAKYDAREGEAAFHTTAGATKLFDIFVQAAPEILANLENAPACQVNGSAKPMFDPSDGSCIRDSVTCLLGRPATDDDMALCTLMLSEASPGDPADLAQKQTIAIAVFLSAANTCE